MNACKNKSRLREAKVDQVRLLRLRVELNVEEANELGIHS